MELALKIISITAIIIGGMAILAGLMDADTPALIGGALFFTQGLLSIIYIGKNK